MSSASEAIDDDEEWGGSCIFFPLTPRGLNNCSTIDVGEDDAVVGPCGKSTNLDGSVASAACCRITLPPISSSSSIE